MLLNLFYYYCSKISMIYNILSFICYFFLMSYNQIQPFFIFNAFYFLIFLISFLCLLLSALFFCMTASLFFMKCFFDIFFSELGIVINNVMPGFFVFTTILIVSIVLSRFFISSGIFDSKKSVSLLMSGAFFGFLFSCFTGNYGFFFLSSVSFQSILTVCAIFSVGFLSVFLMLQFKRVDLIFKSLAVGFISGFAFNLVGLIAAVLTCFLNFQKSIKSSFLIKFIKSCFVFFCVAGTLFGLVISKYAHDFKFTDT